MKIIFPNPNLLQPMPQGVVPDISHSINSGDRDSDFNGSEATQAEVLQPSTATKAVATTNWLFAGLVIALVILLIIWLGVRKFVHRQAA